MHCKRDNQSTDYQPSARVDLIGCIMTPEEIAALKAVPLSMHKKVEAIYHGTFALHKFVEESIVPLLISLLNRSNQEEALVATYYRMYLWLDSAVELRKPSHIQAGAAGARSLFEMLLDIIDLAADPSNGDRFHAFTIVERFRTAQLLVEFHDSRFGYDPMRCQPERAFIADGAIRSQCDHLRETYWGREANGKLRWPKHWSRSSDVFARCQSAGAQYENTYRSAYARLSWYIHPGAAGIGGMNGAAIEGAFGWVHSLFQEFMYDATERVANALPLFAARPELREQLEQTKNVMARSLILAMVDAQQKQAEEEGQNGE